MGLNVRFEDLFLPIDEQIATIVENTNWKYRIYNRRRNVLMRFFQSMFFGQFVYNFNRNTDGNIFETIKMRRLLSKRYKLKAELMVLENDDYDLYDSIVYPYGTSAERYIQINNIKRQIMNINVQIRELLKD